MSPRLGAKVTAANTAQLICTGVPPYRKACAKHMTHSGDISSRFDQEMGRRLMLRISGISRFCFRLLENHLLYKYNAFSPIGTSDVNATWMLEPPQLLVLV